ncbi:ABC transporter ATP-binding protein, partial [Streptomyces sp. SID13726]|nr:ABC transporter ATP-binding protein [Streptomyces sp. SID13726]
TADGRIAGDISDPTPESVLAGLDALRTLEAPGADGSAPTASQAVRA